MKKIMILILSLSILLVGCTSPGGDKADSPKGKERISIVTGGSGGVFYALGAGMADVCNNNSKELEVSSETTAATAENLKLIQLGEAEIGFTVFDALVDAYNGTEPYEAHDKLRLVMRGHSGYIHAYTSDLGMNDPGDFKGKKISMAPGDIGESLLGKTLNAYGLTLGDINGQPMSMTDSNAAMQDGTLDAGFQMMGLPGSSIMEISNILDIKLLSIEDDKLDKIIEAQPAWAKGVIPADTYKGQTEDVSTLKVPYAIFTSSDVSDEVVYEFIKTIMENTDKLEAMHSEGSHYSGENPLFELNTDVPYHSGAEKYLKEKGILK